MPLFTETTVRARAQNATGSYRSAESILLEQMKVQVLVDRHDIFLSHAYDDKELVLGAALILEDLGYSVYLDWRDDPALNRKRISRETAEKLRARMKASSNKNQLSGISGQLLWMERPTKDSTTTLT